MIRILLVVVYCLWTCWALSSAEPDDVNTLSNPKTFTPFCNFKGDHSKYRSPIDILTKRVTPVKIPPFQYTQDHWSCALKFELKNTNYYAEYKFDEKKNVAISGGPLCGTYKFYGFHFHWNRTAFGGSEHSINYKKYAAEVHFVYYNSIYDSFNTAVNSPNGVTVLGFFLQAKKGARNLQFDKLVSDVSQIQTAGSKVNVEKVCLEVFRQRAMSRRYYHYLGSLTVDNGQPAFWFVFKQPIYIRNEQLDIFRRMRNSFGMPLSNVYPIQPLNGRTVYESR